VERDAGEKLQPVFITIDPERDSPQKVRMARRTGARAPASGPAGAASSEGRAAAVPGVTEKKFRLWQPWPLPT
jgi:cytochrome oxidase Cu insertion factor (SCO1/SenC/PrrC family)